MQLVGLLLLALPQISALSRGRALRRGLPGAGTAARGWGSVRLAATQGPEDDEEATFDAGERARREARENYRTMLGDESEEDIRRLIFDYDPDAEVLPVPSEGLMADDSVIPENPNAIEVQEEEALGVAEQQVFSLDGSLNVDMAAESVAPLPPMAGPSSPDVSATADGEGISMTLEGDIVLGEGAGGTLKLPDFEDFRKKQEAKEAEEAERGVTNPIAELQERTRDNLLSELELDPFADADFERFQAEEYDLIAALIGEGSRPFIGIPLPYLQTGHSMLFLITLVCAFVEVPGNPLTELPQPIRDFLSTGLLVTYAINAGTVLLALSAAEQRRQPKALWGIKCFFLGGLALKELTEIEPVKESKR
uniref:Uncharacterized protein n=1 Tax=Phaeomonas parva TaxID=124430 RepID=A0A7S1UFT4_9STRA|mmetsp:Transcript_4622/g.13156  ORF Transcript_4622/g.13156 Transcript_4622/m.13156 type:complete len:366 (+) Transcript_4622:180-1277(+)